MKHFSNMYHSKITLVAKENTKSFFVISLGFLPQRHEGNNAAVLRAAALMVELRVSSGGHQAQLRPDHGG